MKGFVCLHCKSISPHHSQTCIDCGKVRSYTNIEELVDYVEPETQDTNKEFLSSNNIQKNKSKNGCGWFSLFLLMLVSLPITFILLYASCSWGGCDQSATNFVFLTEIAIGVFALIMGIFTSIKSKKT